MEAGGASLSTSFDLNGKALGAGIFRDKRGWNFRPIVYGFTMEETKSPQLWSQTSDAARFDADCPPSTNHLRQSRQRGCLRRAVTLSVPLTYNLMFIFNSLRRLRSRGKFQRIGAKFRLTCCLTERPAQYTAVVLLPVIPAVQQRVTQLLTLPPTRRTETHSHLPLIGDRISIRPSIPQILDDMVSGAQSYSQRAPAVTIPPAFTQTSGVCNDAVPDLGRRASIAGDDFYDAAEVYILPSCALTSRNLAQPRDERECPIHRIVKSDTHQASTSSVRPSRPYAGGSEANQTDSGQFSRRYNMRR